MNQDVSLRTTFSVSHYPEVVMENLKQSTVEKPAFIEAAAQQVVQACAYL